METSEEANNLYKKALIGLKTVWVEDKKRERKLKTVLINRINHLPIKQVIASFCLLNETKNFSGNTMKRKFVLGFKKVDFWNNPIFSVILWSCSKHQPIGSICVRSKVCIKNNWSNKMINVSLGFLLSSRGFEY